MWKTAKEISFSIAVRVRDDDERLLTYNRRSVNGNYYDYRTISRGGESGLELGSLVDDAREGCSTEALHEQLGKGEIARHPGGGGRERSVRLETGALQQRGRGWAEKKGRGRSGKSLGCSVRTWALPWRHWEANLSGY